MWSPLHSIKIWCSFAFVRMDTNPPSSVSILPGITVPALEGSVCVVNSYTGVFSVEHDLVNSNNYPIVGINQNSFSIILDVRFNRSASSISRDITLFFPFHIYTIQNLFGIDMKT